MLNNYLDGTGKAIILDMKKVLGYERVQEAAQTNLNRFFDAPECSQCTDPDLRDIALGLKDGQTVSFEAKWEALVEIGVDRSQMPWEAPMLDDLGYGVGGFTLTSAGSFTLSRSGDIVSVKGSVKHTMSDTYDWVTKGPLIVNLYNASIPDRALGSINVAKPFNIRSTQFEMKLKTELKYKISQGLWGTSLEGPSTVDFEN
jgi:hypothetical protein